MAGEGVEPASLPQAVPTGAARIRLCRSAAAPLEGERIALGVGLARRSAVALPWGKRAALQGGTPFGVGYTFWHLGQ